MKHRLEIIAGVVVGLALVPLTANLGQHSGPQGVDRPDCYAVVALDGEQTYTCVPVRP